jgi:hypothetical protein
VCRSACGAFWSLLFLVFGIIPALELLIGPDLDNPTKEEEQVLAKKWSFFLVTIAWVPLQVLLVIWY